jgi:hypothetical protein
MKRADTRSGDRSWIKISLARRILLEIFLPSRMSGFMLLYIRQWSVSTARPVIDDIWLLQMTANGCCYHPCLLLEDVQLPCMSREMPHENTTNSSELSSKRCDCYLPFYNVVLPYIGGEWMYGTQYFRIGLLHPPAEVTIS